MDIGSILSIFALVICFLLSVNSIFTLAVASLCINALVVLPPSLTGGASLTLTLTSSMLFFCIILLKSDINEVLTAILDIRQFGFLTGYVIWSLAATAVLPAVFMGKIFVYPLSAESSYYYVLTPLRYSSGNITQCLYITISYFISIAVFLLSKYDFFTRMFAKSIFVLCAGITITGVLDAFGFNEFLSLFRNANYALTGDSEIAATKRIVGATPEASSFGFLSCSVLSILLFMPKIFQYKPAWLFFVIVIFAFSVLSTSSTAYGMLGVILVLFILTRLISFFVGTREDSLSAAVSLASLGLFFSLFVLSTVIYPPLKDQVTALLDQLVFGKNLSSSYEERGRWTAASLNAVYDSYFLGIGIGSSRSSNSFASIVSGSGLIGVCLLGLFVFKVFFSRLGLKKAVFGIGPQLAIIPIFFGLILSGATSDYGSIVAILFGVQIRANLVETD